AIMEAEAKRVGEEQGLAWVRPIANTSLYGATADLHRVTLEPAPLDDEEAARSDAIVERCEAQGRNRLHPCANAIGGALLSVRAEGTVEQSLDRSGRNIGNRHIFDHGDFLVPSVSRWNGPIDRRGRAL
ncbi:hypothetical protein, partial [Pseudomonas sp. JAI120]